MLVNKINYPYPVLGPKSDDYNEDCYFFVETDYQEKTGEFGDYFVFNVKKYFNSKGLENLVKQGKAVAFVIVKCPSSIFQKYILLEDEVTPVEIPVNNLSDKVFLCPRIFALEDINDYSGGDEWNQDYFGGLTFDFKAGSILAHGNDDYFRIEDTDYIRNFTSIFPIIKNEGQKESCIPDFDGDNICILLNEETYDLYSVCSGKYGDALGLISTSVIIPSVLTEAITRIKESYEDGEDLSNYKWCRIIERKVKDVTGQDLCDYSNSSSVLSGILLQDMQKRSLEKLKSDIIDDVDE